MNNDSNNYCVTIIWYGHPYNKQFKTIKKNNVHCFVKIYYTIKECMSEPSFYILHICSQNMFIWCNLYAALAISWV